MQACHYSFSAAFISCVDSKYLVMMAIVLLSFNRCCWVHLYSIYSRGQHLAIKRMYFKPFLNIMDRWPDYNYQRQNIIFNSPLASDFNNSFSAKTKYIVSWAVHNPLCSFLYLSNVFQSNFSITFKGHSSLFNSYFKTDQDGKFVSLKTHT